MPDAIGKMKLLSFITILLFALFLPASYAQVDNSLNVFEPVPVNQRARLAERLKLFVEYRRNKQYDRLFEMFPKVHTQHPEITKEQFLAGVKKYGEPHIIDFIPESAQVNPTIDGEYVIYGCAKVREGRRKEERLAATAASLENDEWVFSDIGFIFQVGPGNPEPCSKKRR